MRTTAIVIFILMRGSALCWHSQGVSAPREFRVTSLDLNCIAEWSPEPNVTDNVTYRLQYKSYWSENDLWKTIACPDARLCKCDFTASCSPSFNHTLRVRSEVPGASSEWVYFCCFEPMLSTRLTAPVLSVKVNGLTFSVKVQNLQVRNGADYLHKVFTNFQWLLNYSEEPNDLLQQSVVLTQNHHVFKVPRAGNYCMRAQFHIEDYQIYGDQSAVACFVAQDLLDSLNLSVIIAIILLSTFIVAALSAMSWFHRQKLKALLFPTDPPPPTVLQRLEEESKVQQEWDKTGATKSPIWEDSGIYCIVEDCATDDHSIQLRPLGKSHLQTRFHQSAWPAIDGLNSGLHSSYCLQVDPKLQSSAFTPVHWSMSHGSDCNPAVHLMADVWPDDDQSTVVPFYLPHLTPNLPCAEDSESLANTASWGLDVPYSCIDLNTVTNDCGGNSKLNVTSAGLESKFGVGSPPLNSDPDGSMYSSEMVILVEPASQDDARYRKTWIVPKIPITDNNFI